MVKITAILKTNSLPGITRSVPVGDVVTSNMNGRLLSKQRPRADIK
jgi:hypothetical protein